VSINIVVYIIPIALSHITVIIGGIRYFTMRNQYVKKWLLFLFPLVMTALIFSLFQNHPTKMAHANAEKGRDTLALK